jgi:hypothetical protein
MNYEIIGLTGTLFVLLSFLMKNIKMVRIINIIGAILFVIYGLCINAISTWVLNGVLVIIHIIYLLLMKKNKVVCKNQL